MHESILRTAVTVVKHGGYVRLLSRVYFDFTSGVAIKRGRMAKRSG